MLRPVRAVLSSIHRFRPVLASSPHLPRFFSSHAKPFRPRAFWSSSALPPPSASISLALAAAAAAAATVLSLHPQLEAWADSAASSPSTPPRTPAPADAAEELLRCKTPEEVELAVGQLHAAMAAAAGLELGGIPAKTLTKVLKHAISIVQPARGGADHAAATAVRFMQQLCGTSSAARACVVDAGGCAFLSRYLQHVVQHSPASPCAAAASDALALLAASDAKRVVNDSFPHLAAALAGPSAAAALTLALASPVIIAAAPAMQSTKQFHSLLLPFASAAHQLSVAAPSSSLSLSPAAHAFAILLASSPLPPAPAPSVLPAPLALYLNLMEGAGPAEFRLAAAAHTKLLLAPHAATHKHSRAVVNSLFHTALAPYTGTVPPLQCAAISSIASAASVPSIQSIVSTSLSIGDIISLLPDLPPPAAASVARLAAASVVDAATCAKIVDARADELVTGACAANPKSRELREAAGELMLRLSMHAKGRCSIALTHRALPLLLALSDYSRDAQQQERAVATIGNLALEKFNRYQLGCGGVLEELKSLLLNAGHSDAFKGQCLRVIALIISTNYPPGDDFASKFVSKSALYEICRLAESPLPVVHRNAVWALAALSQNLNIVPSLAPCCKKLLKVLQHGSIEGRRYATFAVSNMACNERAKQFFLSSDCPKLLRANLVYKQDPMLFGASNQALYNLTHKDPQFFNIPEPAKA